eukprot:6232563-Lingulodinium_polyedra.AAC.1
MAKRSKKHVGHLLRDSGLPKWWAALVLSSLCTYHLQAVEVFAGRCALSHAIECPYGDGTVKSFDTRINPEHDLLTTSGLELLISWVVNIKPGGLLWLGVPCATW